MLEELQTLNASLTGDFMTDMEIREKMHEIEMKLNNVKPTDSHFDCEGCGS